MGIVMNELIGLALPLQGRDSPDATDHEMPNVELTEKDNQRNHHTRTHYSFSIPGSTPPILAQNISALNLVKSFHVFSSQVLSPIYVVSSTGDSDLTSVGFRSGFSTGWARRGGGGTRRGGGGGGGTGLGFSSAKEAATVGGVGGFGGGEEGADAGDSAVSGKESKDGGSALGVPWSTAAIVASSLTGSSATLSSAGCVASPVVGKGTTVSLGDDGAVANEDTDATLLGVDGPGG